MYFFREWRGDLTTEAAKEGTTEYTEIY